MGKSEANLRVGQGKLTHDVDHMTEFGGPGFQEFQARWGIEEQLSDFDTAADWSRPFPHLAYHPAIQLQPGSSLTDLCTGSQPQP